MQYSHHQMRIELPIKGIVAIDSIELCQGINRHGCLSLEARVEEDEALKLVEEAQQLSVQVFLAHGEENRPLFFGKSECCQVILRNGLLVLKAVFYGGTRQWDQVKKSQSFGLLQMPYEEVFKQVLSEYGQGSLRDEATGGAVIGQFLLQYEETDWCFLKRLASHFGTVLLPEDKSPYGRAYFGLPDMETGRVLPQEAYTLVNSQEKGDRLLVDVLPQEFYRWQVESREVFTLGEGIRFGHIPVVVTAVRMATSQGRVVYTYELSRKKGLYQNRQYNPKISGMSLGATIQERKGNQVRLKLDLEEAYVKREDRAWFTYAIETSNFYCMPEVGSHAHLYFPDQEEGKAMAVHALRMAGRSRSRTQSQPAASDGGTGGGGTGQGGGDQGEGGYGGSVGAGYGGEGAGSAAGAVLAGDALAEKEAKEAGQEKDPSCKVFSDPSGSFLQLAPGGVTLSPGSASCLEMDSRGNLVLQAKSLTMDSGNTLVIGTGKQGRLPQLYLEASEKLLLSLSSKDSQISLTETAEILATFLKKEASSRRLAQPLAEEIRKDLTVNDSAERERINGAARENLTAAAQKQKEELLAQKEKEANAKIREGIFSILTVVGATALVVFTGGAAAPLVGAMVVTGGFKTVSAIADISEGLSDLEKVEAKDLSPSYNFMRDGVFGGNEALYQGVKSVNDMLFGLVTGKAAAANLNKLEKADDLVGIAKKIQQGQKFLKDNKAVKMVLNVGSEVTLGAVEEYVATGTVNPVNVLVNVGMGSLKGWGMQKVTIPCGGSLNDTARKLTNTFTGTVVGVGADWVRSGLTGEPFDLTSSIQQNLVVAALGEMVGEPIDVVSGAFLLVATDLRLPDIREGIDLTRRYTSTRRKAGWFGRGWQFSYESRLYRDGEILHVTLPCGFVCAFCRKEEQEGYQDTLGNGRFQLTREALEGCWQVEDQHSHSRYRYDEAGRLTWMEDRNGQRMTFTYVGEELTVETALGYRLTFTFKEGKVSQLKDYTGRCLFYAYQGDYLTQVTHPEGGITRYCYDEQGYLCAPIDQTGLTYLTNVYDERGRVTLQTLANGETYTLSYDDRQRQVAVEYSAYPGTTTYRYTKEQTIEEIHHPDGTRTLYGYDECRNRILTTDRLGRKERSSYDGLGRLVRREEPGGLVREYTYDQAGDLVEVRDNGGRKRILTYDDCHNLIRRQEKVSETESLIQSYTYDSKGRLTSETDGEGHTTSYHYEENSAYPATTTYADGTQLFCTYSETGRMLSEEDGAVSFSYGYNPGGYQTLKRDGEGNETHYHYDGMGRHVSTYSPRQVKEGKKQRTLYRYDFLERLVETHHPDGSREVLKRDGEGNVLTRIHPNAYDPVTGDGEGTGYHYSLDHQLLAIHHPEGGVERFICDALGNRIKHILPQQYDPETDDGPGYTYAYDEKNRLTLVRGMEGEVLARYGYDSHGNCIVYQDEQGAVHHYAYDLLGQLLQELTAIGETGEQEKGRIQAYQRTTYAYDKNGNCIREIRYGGSYTKEGQLIEAGEDLKLAFTYDAKNRLIRVEDSTGARVSYTYDARGNRIREEQVIRATGSAKEQQTEGGEKGAEGSRPVVRIIHYTYDKAGRLTLRKELLDPGIAGEEKQWAKTAYTYDENGNPVHIRTPEGYEICRSFDERDRLSQETLEDRENDIRLTTTLTYDKAGNLIGILQEGREGKRQLTCTYDLKDRLTRLHQLEGPVFAYGYDQNDNRIREEQLLPGGKDAWLTTDHRYDQKGNLLSSHRRGTELHRYRYDAFGNRMESQDADGVGVSLSYGLDGQVTAFATSRAKAEGQVSQQLSYDARGRITGIERAGGAKTGFTLDGWGRIRKATTAEGRKEEYTYDEAGNLLTSLDALGGVITYGYNSNSQVASITDPLGRTEYFYYDKEGRQTRHVDRKGTITETRYNVYGKPVFQVCTDQKGRRQVMGSWAYDDFGHLTEARAGGFHYTYRHRPDGKLLEKRSKGRTVLTCTYYPEGTLKSLTDEKGKPLIYTYDEEGRLESLETGEGRVLTRYGYTTAGRIASMESENGIQTRYTYDGEGNIKSLAIRKGEHRLLYDARFTYDLRGNRLSKTGQQRRGTEGTDYILPMNTVYTYDVMDRLVKEDRPEGGEEYTYDGNGNRLTRTCYHYALIKEKGKAGFVGAVVDATENYWYNEGNQLVKRRRGGETTSYTYDTNGSLIRKVTRNEEAGAGEKEQATLYHYDFLNRQEKVELSKGKNLTAHYDGEGLRAGLTTTDGESYTFLYHQGELIREEKAGDFYRSYLYGHGLAALEAEGDHYSCHLNEQGSTIYLTNGRGETGNYYDYDAFGNLLEQKEGISNRIRYTGQQHDQETGQYYLRARYYHPGLGRFIQEDTYRGDGLNLYAYCANNPVMYFDPSGHGKTELCGEDPNNKPGDTLADGVDNQSGTSSELKINQLPLAKPGEDLYVGTYNKSNYWNKKTGLNTTHTPHHAVQDAVSSVSKGKGITINIKQSIHPDTGSYKTVRTGLNSNRQHLAADIAELRVLLKNEGYSRSVINAQLNELIKQNKALGGFEK